MSGSDEDDEEWTLDAGDWEVTYRSRGLMAFEDSEEEEEEEEPTFGRRRASTPARPTRAQRDAFARLPEEERESLEGIFHGASLEAMRFLLSEHEQKQRREVLEERIAHELRHDTNGVQEKMNGHRFGKTSKQCFYALWQREQFGRTTKAQMIKLHETFMPFQQHKHCSIVDQVRERLYCGGFDSTGQRFLVAGQLENIVLYDTMDWTRSALLPAREVQWTVTDAKFMPDDQSVLYSTIFNHVRMVDTDYEDNGKEAVFHLALPRADERSQRAMYRRGFGVWSLDVNGAGTQLIAGTSNHSVVLYDMESDRTVCHVIGHDDDVNAVAFVDGQVNANVFVSGSDDTFIKLWDRRVLSESSPQPQGVFPGHYDGLTYISSRGDGYYFLSNSKDQTCKLWDIRKCVSSAEVAQQRFTRPFHWDYRYHRFPGLRQLPTSHPHDASVMTYRGHCVAETLIRCHFSPMHTTAQKYVFTGSADGRVYVFDTISGSLVEIFSMRRDGVTRDVRWHPYEPMIVSPDFYGKLCVWQRQDAVHEQDHE